MILLLPSGKVPKAPPRGRSWFVWNLVKAAPIRKSSSMRASTASTCRWSRSIGFLAAWRMCLGRVSRCTDCVYNGGIRSLNIAKSCPLDFKSLISFQSFRAYFTANMFTFSITIGPDEKGFGTSCLAYNVF